MVLMLYLHMLVKIMEVATTLFTFVILCAIPL